MKKHFQFAFRSGVTIEFHFNLNNFAGFRHKNVWETLVWMNFLDCRIKS